MFLSDLNFKSVMTVNRILSGCHMEVEMQEAEEAGSLAFDSGFSAYQLSDPGQSAFFPCNFLNSNSYIKSTCKYLLVL